MSYNNNNLPGLMTSLLSDLDGDDTLVCNNCQHTYID